MQLQGNPSFVQIAVQAGDTIGNTTTGSMFATRFTATADSLTIGQIMRITSGGSYNTAAVALRNFTHQFNIGTSPGVAIFGTGTRTPTAVGASLAWWNFRGDIIITATGTAGLLEGNGIWAFSDFTSAVADNVFVAASTGGIAIDTTIDNEFGIVAQYAVADANNTITQRHLTVHVGV